MVTHLPTIFSAIAFRESESNDLEHCFEKKYGKCILPKNGTFSLPKNRLAEDKVIVTHHIMGNVQDYS